MFVASVDSKSLVWVFALCIWDVAGLLPSRWCMKEGISLYFRLVPFFRTSQSATSSLDLLPHAYISFLPL